MESARSRNDLLTPSQRRAVAARGNVLVMAGAGTGKTHTLVARCLDCLCRERASLDEILVVTFTEAAATEMKQRLREALEQTLNYQPSTLHQHLAEQLALFDTAPIGTLHSFCLRLVREHFYELGLDPQLAVLDSGESRLLAEETLDELFQVLYAGKTDFSMAAQDLVQIYGNGDDHPIRVLLLRLYHYVQTRPDANRWLTKQLARFALSEPIEWREWLDKAIRNWRDEWLPVLQNLGAPASGPARNPEPAGSETGAPVANEKAAELAAILSQLGKDDAAQPAAEVLAQIISADSTWPAKRKGVLREPLKHFFAEAAFLQSLLSTQGDREPLAEDWDWIRGYMSALLQLAQEFGRTFAERKRVDGVLDFHDLEQFALELLWDPLAHKPTAIARRWRQKIRFVFVDEYQDINAAQDQIISALSRDGTDVSTPSARPSGDKAGVRATEFETKSLLTPPLSSDSGREGEEPSPQKNDPAGNRFLVGDVKQSIYRFRLADPKIFRDYAQTWRKENGQVIPLTENFRSRESLLGFVNSVFELLMCEDVGGVEYDAGSRLQFGKPEERAALGLGQNRSPRAELLLRLKGGRDEGTDDDESSGNDLRELEETEKEARLVAHRLRELLVQGHNIWDEKQHAERAVEWRDMAVLLRAPANKAEAYAKEFERAGVPLVVERGGFYDSPEIADLLGLFRLLDNPLQDIPAIAVLRSPLVGLSLDELATIRLAAKNVHFWTSLNRMQTTERKLQNELHQKIERFLERFARWRQLARQASLSQCLECVLAETHYAGWLRARPRGAQRQANVERFLGLAQRFDQFQRQGLFRFLKFIEAQQMADSEPEVAAAVEEDAVRLMSIHQSKGLEFPVVVVADLAKPFNEQDLRGEIIFDEEFGVCPRVKPPHIGRRYPSLPYWLAQRHQRREQRGEELRLLYVAMTRARDTLILTATLSETKWTSFWQQPEAITTQAVVSAKTYADWLGLWFGIRSSESEVRNVTNGEWPYLRWRLVADDELAGESKTGNQKSETEIPALDNTTTARLRAILSWEYSFDAATQRAAKSSVTALRRQAEELDDEAKPMFQTSNRSDLNRQSAIGNRQLTAAAIGTAHHKFLQYFSLENAGSLKSLESEAKRLEHEKNLSADEVAALNLANIAVFWSSPVGEKILAQRKRVQRELPFTAKFSPAEVDAIIGAKTPPELEEDFVVVQGVADLAVLLSGEIWLVDFKTDEIKPRDLADRSRHYEPQLKLYTQALSRIYSQPVTHCWLHFLNARQTVDLRV